MPGCKPLAASQGEQIYHVEDGGVQVACAEQHDLIRARVDNMLILRWLTLSVKVTAPMGEDTKAHQLAGDTFQLVSVVP